MDKTIGKWLSLLLLMFCAGNAAFAQKLTAEDFSIKAGESKYITIVYEGTEAMHGFQTDITLSEGLSCDDYPIGIAEGFLCNSNDQGTNGYRVAGYNEEGGTASNGDGIIALTVKASDDFTGGTIKLTHTEISFEGDNAVNPEDLTVNVTVEKEPVVEGDKYALFTGDIEPGDYIIYYDGKAMNTTIATNRLQYEEVTPVDNAIVNPSADIVWTIAKDGDNYTIYNAANKGYAASNGTKNQAAFATEVSDNARWTVSGTETYEFVNVANSAAGVNANLRNNGTYGFACYSTGTGGALTLYKKVEAGEVVKPVLTESQTFAGSLTVEITAEEGADIYYTTDGTEPVFDATGVSGTKYTEPFDVTETTTVKAIAVLNGVSSEVATATYTIATPITIAEAQALEAGSEAFIQGVCVASAANGAVLYDGTDYIYYYNNANEMEVGKSYTLEGKLSKYGGANQFVAAATVKEITDLNLAVPTDVTELSATDLDAAVEAKVVDPRQLASITGTLAISGNYVNLTVDGTETSMGSIVKPKEDVSAFDGKKVVVTGYEMYVNNKYVYFVATNIEETNAFAVFVDEELEGGTITAEPTEAEEGATITLTVTPEGENKVEEVLAYYMVVSTNPETGDAETESKDIEVTAAEDGTYTFVMPAADAYVTATFRTKNEPGEYKDTPLTQDMFKGWDGFDDYAKVNNERPYWDADPVPGDFGAGKTVYGSGNVTNSDYADITGTQTMRINGTPGMQFRVMFNRQEDTSIWTELQPTIGEEGYVDVDLSEYEYVHLNAIKTGWGSAAGTVESIILNPSEEDEPIEGENWTFDENPEDVITVTTQGYQRNIPEGSDQITGLQPVTGWTPGTQTESDPGFTAGIFAYGSENLLNNKVAAPAAAPEGSESPSALGLSAVWGGVAQYTQPITLQPGNYKFVYVLYNGANTGAVTKNLFGFIAEDGTEYLSDKTTFPVGEWDGGEVTFTLEEETTGNLSVGFIGSGGSGNAPHLFVDFIDIEKIDEADVAKDELEKAIEAAQAKEYVIGDELFQYPQSEIDPLDEAIAAAQAVYDNEDATVDEVNAATETLNNFIETFDPAYNEPEEGTPYIMTLTTSDGQFPLAIDGTANKIVEEDEETYIYFDKQEDGTWGMKTEDGDYIAYEGSNKWTMSTSTEPYGWTIEALKDGGVSITGQNGLYGTNTSDGNAAGSAIYGDKTTANGNYIWNIEPAEQEPEGTLYNGTLTQTLTVVDGTVMGEDVDNDYDVFITAPDPNNGVKIQFVDGFTFPAMGIVVPDLIVDAQMTTNEDGSISYSSEPFTVSVPRGMITVTFNATLTGTQENEKATPVITLTLSQGPTTNTVVFGPREEGVFLVKVEEDIENGTVTPDVETAKEGDTVNITVTPNEGYEIEYVNAYYEANITEGDGFVYFETVAVRVTQTEDGGYTFTMPAADVTVNATFTEVQGLPDYVFVASEWQAGDPGRISPENVTVDEAANTITVDKTGNQNVNLQFKGIDYNVPAENKYFVVQGTGMTPDGAQLWWMNNDWIGTIQPEVYTVGDETLYAWPLEGLKTNGGSGEPITLASDTEDAKFWNAGGWSTCFGLTLADPATPAVITNVGFLTEIPAEATGINRINIDGADFAATIDNALRNGKVFDISGRKVNSVVKGGIYIVDGVKMVVRK